MRRSGPSARGRLATRLAVWLYQPYLARRHLAVLSPHGYIAPSATLHHSGLRLGEHVFIGDRVIIFQDMDGGAVDIARRVELIGDITIQTGLGGSVAIGDDTHIQPRCQLSAYQSSITIGRDVNIAPNCGFYPYDHGVVAGIPIGEQPLCSKGAIVVDDEAWLGYGVVVLSGVRIGKGAVVGAGSVVTRSIPDGAIAAGVPARVVKMRS